MTAGPARIDRPVFIVSPPRSGSSLLFETLGRAPGVHTIGTESHGLIEGVRSLVPAERGWESNRLTEADATAGTVAFLKDRFVNRLRDRADARPTGGPTRMLEKTPKNALRIPFLAAAFPDARFVYLYRDPRETISSMLDAWRSGLFVTYPDLPGWTGQPWSLLLVPGWRELIGRPLGEVVAQQWATTVDILLEDLGALPSDRWCVASYDRLVAEP
ncbi:MAG: sulfotransferase, partial [Acidobacteria bacterium]|nr:sulfotransferase [Acidobacteriota bacterium]